MKKGIISALIALLACSVFGQEVADKTYGITGTMTIDFLARKNLDDAGSPQPGVKNKYMCDVNVAETLHFGGLVEAQPPIFNKFGMEKQPAFVYYALNLGIRNPSNLAADPVAIGRFVGGVPIDKKGVYQYDKGTARIAVDGRNQASGFESKFQGVTAGKKPETGSLTEKLTSQAMTLKKQVQGKSVAIMVTKYDKLAWDATLPAGPVRSYSEVRLAGEMLYDYERYAWYFNNMTATYTVNGKPVTDRIAGNVKWTPSPAYKTTGEGAYQFDVRLNEPDAGSGASEAAVFAATDESAFFAADSAMPALQGTMKYKDTVTSDETVTASKVDINLVGNKLTKAQVVYLAKLFVFAAIVPMNDE